MNKIASKAKQLRDEIRSIDISLLDKREKIRLLVRYGTLAPSTHNTQPWKVKINSDSVDIFADLDKKIPKADPTGRDLYISVGTFIKNIELAAKDFGLNPKIELSSSDNGKSAIAMISFKNLDKAKNLDNNEYLDAITIRQNFRGFFEKEIDKKIIEKEIKESKLNGVRANIIFDPTTKEELARLTVSGLKLAYKDEEFRNEISSYINSNISKKLYGLHGYSLRLNLPMSIIVPKLIKKKDVGEKLAKLNYKSFISAPAVVVLSSKDSETDWVKVGMNTQEIFLRLVRNSIFSSVYVAAIEMGNLRVKLRHKTGQGDELLPQILFCVGRTPDLLPYSVREDVAKISI